MPPTSCRPEQGGAMAGTGVPRGARALWRLGSALPCLGKVGGTAALASALAVPRAAPFLSFLLRG